jgi:hypothetical protein
LIAVYFIIFKPEGIKGFFGRYKKIKAGASGFELETNDALDGKQSAAFNKALHGLVSMLVTIEAGLKGIIESGEKRNKEVDGQLNGIKKDVAKLFTLMSDYEELQDKLSEGTLENMFFNENVSMFKRLKAYKRLIALKKNGKIKAEGFKLICAHKETWEAVQETEMKLNIVDQDYFNSTMKDIDRVIFKYY